MTPWGGSRGRGRGRGRGRARGRGHRAAVVVWFTSFGRGQGWIIDFGNSNKQKATSKKQQAKSNKQQATSNKQVGFIRYLGYADRLRPQT